MTGSEEKTADLQQNKAFVGKWKLSTYVCINGKRNTLVFSVFASGLHGAVARRMKLKEIDLYFIDLVSVGAKLEMIM